MGHRVFEADDADIDVPLLEDAVVGEKLVDVGKGLQERIAPRGDVVDKSLRQILMHAAGTEIVRVQTRPARALIEHHELLALLEAPERRRQRADVERERRDVQDMVQDAADFAIEHADELAADRRRDPEQTLDRETERVLLVHRRDIVEPVEIRDGLKIGLVLDELFGAAMQKPDMRIDPAHDLAVELRNHAQHAVRRRMLRPEIDGEIAVLGRPHAKVLARAPCFRCSTPISHRIALFPGKAAFVRQAIVASFSASEA